MVKQTKKDKARAMSYWGKTEGTPMGELPTIEEMKESLMEEAENIRESAWCPNCNYMYHVDNGFCIRCGTSMAYYKLQQENKALKEKIEDEKAFGKDQVRIVSEDRKRYIDKVDSITKAIGTRDVCGIERDIRKLKETNKSMKDDLNHIFEITGTKKHYDASVAIRAMNLTIEEAAGGYKDLNDTVQKLNDDIKDILKLHELLERRYNCLCWCIQSSRGRQLTSNEIRELAKKQAKVYWENEGNNDG